MPSTFEYDSGVAVADLPPLRFNEDNLPELFVRAVELQTGRVHADPDYDGHMRHTPHNIAIVKTFGPSGTRCPEPNVIR